MKFIRYQNIRFSAFVTAVAIQSPSAFAQNCTGVSSNLGEVVGEVTCEVRAAPNLFTSAAYIMGIGFTIAGLLKMKEFVDDPGRSFMKDALIRLGVGALLIILPFAINVAQNSFGGTAGSTINPESLQVFTPGG